MLLKPSSVYQWHCIRPSPICFSSLRTRWPSALFAAYSMLGVVDLCSLYLTAPAPAISVHVASCLFTEVRGVCLNSVPFCLNTELLCLNPELFCLNSEPFCHNFEPFAVTLNAMPCPSLPVPANNWPLTLCIVEVQTAVSFVCIDGGSSPVYCSFASVSWLLV